ncbi:MAG: hypothetical protein ACR2P1_16715 [Pseudomonadales bacterium]
MLFAGLRISSAVTACTALLVTALAAAVSADDLDGYVMAVHNHAPGHKQIEAGDYDKAIAVSLNARRAPPWKVSAETNLCVSYTVLKQYDRAQRACTKAIHAARSDRRLYLSLRRDSGTVLAQLYCNRGVLKAISEDLEGAAKDFSKARHYNADSEQYAVNYARLQKSLRVAQLDQK